MVGYFLHDLEKLTVSVTLKTFIINIFNYLADHLFHEYNYKCNYYYYCISISITITQY